ncbi:MAG: fused MFS/spermidine synthase [Blastocatellales bacterium]|nr:fused MFS/spermidine synthase [Blastocatellales bacterium]
MEIDAKGRSRTMYLLFAFTLFLSASLLFVVQPMFGKMVLPTFGGSSAVWVTALAFFQLMLLAGYVYIHFTTTFLEFKKQVLLHLAVLISAIWLLPIEVSSGWMAAAPERPLASVTITLFSSIGLPFFALSASAPLLQRWFARSGHPDAGDPYFLYAASNFGSLGGLLAYPVLIEPVLRLKTQSYLWSIGYSALILLAGVCALRVWRGAGNTVVTEARGMHISVSDREKPGWLLRLRWLGLAAIPSSLLVSVTAYVTTDFAVPLFWVTPLAIYLSTFILVFSQRRIVPHKLMRSSLPFAVAIPLALVSGHAQLSLELIIFPLLALFIVSMVCHGELAASRPEVRYLTEFYLWLSLGGAVGGLFNIIVAPLIFASAVEYHLGLVLACLAAAAGARESKPSTGKRKAKAATDDSTESRVSSFAMSAAYALILGISVMLLQIASARLQFAIGSMRFVLFVFGAPLVIALLYRRNHVFLAMSLAAMALAAHYNPEWNRSVVTAERSFFGAYRVADSGDVRALVHGNTNHGVQSLLPRKKCDPLGYYFPTGPFGHLFSSFRGTQSKTNIGIVGLGAGATASYAKPGQEWTFYEIDPLIEQIAKNPKYFTFLSECAPQARVILGDARISIAAQPDGIHDVIVLDAFNSDSVPVHLLTREALELYLRKLSPNGVVVYHISNRHLDLRSVLARLARDARLYAFISSGTGITALEQRAGKVPSLWVVMVRKPEDLGTLTRDQQWAPLSPDVAGAAWSDDFSYVLGAIRLMR